MIRHLFKLVWNRRRANGLILVELLICFLVLSGVLAVAVNSLDHWRQPLRFDYRDVLILDMEHDPYSTASDESRRALKETAAQIELTLQGMGQIAAVSPSTYNLPYTGSSSMYRTYIQGRPQAVEISEVSPEMIDVLRFELISGRWLEPGDEALSWVPVVISRNLAEGLFGTEDPIGKMIPDFDWGGRPTVPDEEEPPTRIVGVIAPYRRHGEFALPAHSDFRPASRDPENLAAHPPNNFALRLHPGVTAAFEEELLNAVQGVAPDWTFSITSLEDSHEQTIRGRLLMLLAEGVVAGFLILMVGMGLVGVLWQSVTRRTHEIGLRRALGATAARIRWQVLGELLALTTLAVGSGVVIFVQLPILQVFSSVAPRVYLIALAIALLVIYPFVILCGLYPSWLATRVHPVEALQHE